MFAFIDICRKNSFLLLW